MALQKTLTITGPATVRDGIIAVFAGEQTVSLNAYIKVESVQGSKDLMGIVVKFSGGSTQFQKIYSFTLDLEGPNPIKQAYQFLKSLPEFADATDC